MLKFMRRTWHELVEEAQFVSQYLVHWWGSMSDSKQLFLFAGFCTMVVLLGLRRPTNPKTRTYDDNTSMTVFQQFMFGAVVLLVFTYGIDVIVESF